MPPLETLALASRVVVQARATREKAQRAYGRAHREAAERREQVRRMNLKARVAREKRDAAIARARDLKGPVSEARRLEQRALGQRRAAIVGARARGYTDVEIAEALHVHPSHVSRIARGERT